MELIRFLFFVACVIIILYKRLWQKCKNNVEEDLQGDTDGQESNEKKSRDELQFTLESINFWLNNCDQKAGMLLAVIGVAITILFTSDFVKLIRGYIFTPFFEFCEGQGEFLFSWGAILCLYLFSGSGCILDYNLLLFVQVY